MKGATVGHAKQRIRRRPLSRPHRADDHRRRVAEPDLQRARDPAGHGEAPRSFRAHGARDRRIPGRRRHGRGDPLPARDPAEPGQRRRDGCRWSSPGPRRANGTSSVCTRSSATTLGPVAQRRYKIILADPARRGCRSHARPRARCAPSRASDRQPLLLQLGAAHRARFSAARSRRPTTSMARASSCTATSRRTRLAVNLRRAFSGIVAGNVREAGMRLVEAARTVRAARRSDDHRRAREDC